jgi:trimethylamine:corrinoid methyltransferase-like protein
MASGQSSTRLNGDNGRGAEKDVPVQVMVPEKVRRQLAIMSAERGESIRTVVLRALGEIGIKVPKEQLVDRRGRRRQSQGKSNGAV